jgi:hypothetical protein
MRSMKRGKLASRFDCSSAIEPELSITNTKSIAVHEAPEIPESFLPSSPISVLSSGVMSPVPQSFSVVSNPEPGLPPHAAMASTPRASLIFILHIDERHRALLAARAARRRQEKDRRALSPDVPGLAPGLAIATDVLVTEEILCSAHTFLRSPRRVPIPSVVFLLLADGLGKIARGGLARLPDTDKSRVEPRACRPAAVRQLRAGYIELEPRLVVVRHVSHLS